MDLLEGKNVLITGGFRGVGLGIGQTFKAKGANVILTDLPSGNNAEALAKEGFRTFICDVTDRAKIANLVAEVERTFGPLNVLVNNAGLPGRDHDFLLENYDEEKFMRSLGVHLLGPINMTVAFLGQLKQTKGVVVNIASAAGLGTSRPISSAYSITKAALIMLTKRLSFELAKYGIRVNAVAPGTIAVERRLVGLTPDEMEETYESAKALNVLHSVGRPEDVGSMVVFLSSDDASFITGQVIVMDGGRTDYLSHSV
jgi:3-oxoacyl-[acyl-carrier protein] reductase